MTDTGLTVSERIRDYIAANPGVMAAQIAKALDAMPMAVEMECRRMARRGVLAFTEAGVGNNNHPKLAYSVRGVIRPSAPVAYNAPPMGYGFGR